MAKATSIQKLVNALSKAEKRYFKMYASLQQGSKDYVTLFDLFQKHHHVTNVKAAFKKIKPNASYETSSKHLYKVLTYSLLHLRMEQGKNTSLVMQLMKANILFEKSLYEEGFSELRKIQSAAKAHEQYLIQLWAIRTELYYLSNLNFHAVTENQLVKKQMQIQESIKYISNIHKHNNLYELLRYRLVYKGHVRTAKQHAELNDLVVTEMNIMSNSMAESFESHKTHLLFQANYFITVNDYKSALKTFHELNDLLEKHRFLWEDEPLIYINTIEGILDSLHTIHQYDGMNYFFTRLNNLKKTTVYLEVMVQRVIYIYKITALLNNGNFTKALNLKAQFEDSLLKKADMLDTDKRAELLLYTALIYFVNNDMNKAHAYLSKVLLHSNQYYNLPVYQIFRLIHLLVHYELGNHDFVDHEIRSVKRKLYINQKKTYKIEKIVFSFLQTPLTSLKQGQETWQKFRDMFNAIENDKYEIQVLKKFDFAAWIEAKLCKKSFEKILKQKIKSVAG